MHKQFVGQFFQTAKILMKAKLAGTVRETNPRVANIWRDHLPAAQSRGGIGKRMKAWQLIFLQSVSVPSNSLCANRTSKIVRGGLPVAAAAGGQAAASHPPSAGASLQRPHRGPAAPACSAPGTAAGGCCCAWSCSTTWPRWGRGGAGDRHGRPAWARPGLRDKRCEEFFSFLGSKAVQNGIKKLLKYVQNSFQKIIYNIYLYIISVI